jgi:hypothetical protein
MIERTLRMYFKTMTDDTVVVSIKYASEKVKVLALVRNTIMKGFITTQPFTFQLYEGIGAEVIEREVTSLFSDKI